MIDAIIIGVCVIGLGIHNLFLHIRLKDAKEQIQSYYDLVVQMAQELQDLGSPNVKVMKNETE